MKSHKVCFIYTHTNNIHQTNENVSKKNIFEFGRLICLNYLIGYYENDKFIEEIKEKFILTPKCITFNKKAEEIHNISFDRAIKKGFDNKYVMDKFKNDLKGVSVIIGHNLNFHLKAIQVELFRTYTFIEFNNYILIDLMNYGHNIKPASLNNIAKNYELDKYKEIKLMKKLFIILYNNINKNK